MDFEKNIPYEMMDPTKEMRSALLEKISNLAVNEIQKDSLEKFRKGLFMIPSETLNDVKFLIESLPKESQDDAYGDLNEILEKGM